MVNSINWGPTPTINSLVDQGSWDRLSGLGDKYRETQKRQLLSQLGDDPEANKRILLGSGDPALAQLGLNYQQKDIDRIREDARYSVTDKRAQELLDIQKAQARRAQGTYDQEARDRAEAAALFKTIGGGGTAVPTPFPAPLPGQQAAPPQAAPMPPPQAAPQAAVEPPAFEATPRLPAGLQQTTEAPPPAPPPVMAQDDTQDVPQWAQDPSGLAARAASNLVSGKPAATAGISRDQLGAMYANPITRPLATALLQKMYDPGTWTYQQVGTKLVALNNRGETKVIMEDTKPLVVGSHALVPDGQGGYRDIAPQAPIQQDPDKRLVVPDGRGGYKDVTPGGDTGEVKGKIPRENEARFKDAKSRGLDDDTANYYALNGRLPKEEISPTTQKLIDTHDATAKTGLDVIDSLQEMKRLSKTAYEGLGASKRADAGNALGRFAPQGAIDTLKMQNLALQNITQQAKTLFPGRILKSEIDLMQKIETLPEHPDAARQDILNQLENLIKKRVQSSEETAKAMRSGVYFKKGYTPSYGRGEDSDTGSTGGAAADPLGLRGR